LGAGSPGLKLGTKQITIMDSKFIGFDGEELSILEFSLLSDFLHGEKKSREPKSECGSRLFFAKN